MSLEELRELIKEVIRNSKAEREREIILNRDIDELIMEYTKGIENKIRTNARKEFENFMEEIAETVQDLEERIENF